MIGCVTVQTGAQGGGEAKAGTLESLQVLRGFAAMIVVLCHVNGAFNERFSVKPLGPLLDGGYVGVDLFFCLSGFIMYYTSRNQIGVRGGAVEFMMRRILRIYPLYWILTFLTIGVAQFESHLVNDWKLNVPYVVKSLFLVPQPFAPVMYQAWTLVHEVKFYAVFAGLMLLPVRWAVWGFWVWVGGSFVVLCVSHFEAGWLLGSLAGKGLTYFFHPASLEFALGIAAAWVVLKARTEAWMDAGVLLLGVMSTGLLLVYFNELKPETRYFALVMFILPTFFLVLGGALVERRWRMKFPRLLVFLGNASYSTYMTHALLLPSMVWMVIPEKSSPGLLVWAALAIGLLLHGLGAGVHWGLEAPMHRWSRSLMQSWRSRSPRGTT